MPFTFPCSIVFFFPVTFVLLKSDHSMIASVLIISANKAKSMMTESRTHLFAFLVVHKTLQHNIWN